MKLKKEDFIKLDAESLPKPNVVVWCMRKDGRVILAFRDANPIAPDGSNPWNYCHWRAFGFDGGELIAECGSLDYNTSFSDVTVDSWASFTQPVLE